jgi:hypothetical protein
MLRLSADLGRPPTIFLGPGLGHEMVKLSGLGLGSEDEIIHMTWLYLFKA